MRSMLRAMVLGLALASGSVALAETDASASTQVPAGDYTLDKAHASLVFRIDHIGFSNYTGQFKTFDAHLRFDPANLARSSVVVKVDPRSLDVNSPPQGFVDTLLNAEWLSAARFPEITFKSTRVEVTGPSKLRIHGELDFRGTRQPVRLDATFNGGYAGHPYDPHARVGFSARGTLQRSKFGMTVGLPPPDSRMGVGDDVEFVVEAEFSGPPWQKAQ